MRYVAGAVGPAEGAYDADVIILAMERVDETLAAIASALAQIKVSHHLTILDQGSRPETLLRFSDAIQGRRDATLLCSDHNLGVAEGRNRATAWGHGRVIAALDNDAEFATPDTLARMVAVLDATPNLAAIACRIVRFDTGNDDLTSWGYPPALLPQAASTFPSVTFVGAGHAIRRSAWYSAGGYDPILFFCWEELDFCLRAIALGWHVTYRGDLVIRHKVSAEQRVAWSGTRWFHFVRNRLYIGRKHGDSWLALVPRMVGYVLKGARNGLLAQSLRAIPAAMRLTGNIYPRALPPAARAYLQRHDAAHRGSWGWRWRSEILARLTPATHSRTTCIIPTGVKIDSPPPLAVAVSRAGTAPAAPYRSP